MTTALCPGSFDPLTRGHLDIIERASAMFDRVIVGVGLNLSKTAMFSADDRTMMVREACSHLSNVEATTIDGLLVDFAHHQGATAIVKGLRSASDYDYEAHMAQMNRALTGIETVLLPTTAEWSFVSSTLVREVAKLGGDVSAFVPGNVADRMRRIAGED